MKVGATNMITIYQIRRVDVFSSEDKKQAKYDMMLGAKHWKPEFAKFYTAQYQVETDDLEVAFDATNLWNEDHPVSVERLNHQPSPSSSVGDVFVRGDEAFIVDDIGFKQIENVFGDKNEKDHRHSCK